MQFVTWAGFGSKWLVTLLLAQVFFQIQTIVTGQDDLDESIVSFLSANAKTLSSRLEFTGSVFYSSQAISKIGQEKSRPKAQQMKLSKIGMLACRDGGLFMSITGKRLTSHVPFSYYFRSSRQVSFVPPHLRTLLGSQKVSLPGISLESELSPNKGVSQSQGTAGAVFDFSLFGQQNLNIHQLKTCPISLLFCGEYLGSNLFNGIFLDETTYRFYEGKLPISNYRLNSKIAITCGELVVHQEIIGNFPTTRILTYDLTREYVFLKRLEFGTTGQSPQITMRLGDYKTVSMISIPTRLVVETQLADSNTRYVQKFVIDEILDEPPAVETFKLGIDGLEFTASPADITRLRSVDFDLLLYTAKPNGNLTPDVSDAISIESLGLSSLDHPTPNRNWTTLYLSMAAFLMILSGFWLIRRAKAFGRLQ